MKLTILSVFLAFLISFYSNAQWFRQVPTPTYANLSEIHFADSNVGWTIGGLGYLTKTTDGGVSWFLQSCETIEYLNDISFMNTETGILVANRGQILKTTDGGNLWNQVYQTKNSENLNSVSITENGSVFVAGNYGKLLKSSDNGENWSEFELGITHHFSDVKFFNDSVGLMIGVYYFNNYNDGSYQIFKTTNAGSSWTVELDSLKNALNKIFITNDFLGYVVGNAGKIFKTTNYGVDWITLNSGTNKNLNDVFFIDNSTGFAVGDSGIVLKTTDSGFSWQSVGSSLTQYCLRTISFLDNNVGYAAGDRGLLLKTTDKGESWTLETKYQLGDEFYNLCFVNNKFGVAVGFEGAVAITKDGGNTWLQLRTDLNDYWSGVSFIDTLTGIITGKRIIKTTDGGQTWQQKSNLGGGAVDYVNENTIMVTSGYGKLLRSTDAGESWNEQIINTSNGLSDIQFFDSMIGYVVGDSGTVFKTTDGGVTWVEKSIPVSDQFTKVKFVNSNVGTIVGSSIYRTTNGGESWIKQVLPSDFTNYYLYGVDFFDENNGIATGTAGWHLNNSAYWGGFIIRTIDGGVNWEVELPGIYEFLFRISFVNQNNIWISSSCGVLHTTNTGVTFIEEDNKKNIIPKDFILEQNYPNPFNPSTVIRYQLPVAGNVIFKVYDVLGNEVASLVNENKSAGNYEVDFNAKNLSSGVYFYKLQVGSFSQTMKMILLK